MYAIYLHLRRYLAWGAFGAALLAVPFFLTLIRRQALEEAILPLALIAAAVGGVAFVLIRAVIGGVTRWPAGVADRALAVWLVRFFVGVLWGFVVASVFFVVVSQYPPAVRRPLFRSGLFLPAFLLGGGVAALLVGWLGRPRFTMLLVRSSCVAILALIACGLVAAFQ
jgi:hypothetical protein